MNTFDPFDPFGTPVDPFFDPRIHGNPKDQDPSVTIQERSAACGRGLASKREEMFKHLQASSFVFFKEFPAWAADLVNKEMFARGWRTSEVFPMRNSVTGLEVVLVLGPIEFHDTKVHGQFRMTMTQRHFSVSKPG